MGALGSFSWILYGSTVGFTEMKKEVFARGSSVEPQNLAEQI
jgi:hypothetical protein